MLSAVLTRKRCVVLYSPLFEAVHLGAVAVHRTCSCAALVSQSVRRTYGSDSSGARVLGAAAGAWGHAPHRFGVRNGSPRCASGSLTRFPPAGPVAPRPQIPAPPWAVEPLAWCAACSSPLRRGPARCAACLSSSRTRTARTSAPLLCCALHASCGTHSHTRAPQSD